MLSVLGRRIFLEALPTLLYLVALTFFLLRVVPGGPFDGERAWPPEVKAELERRYGLDQPLPVQFGHWLSGLARGDLGSSFQYLDRGVGSMIAEALPVSLSLGAWALALSIALGISLGGLAAWKRGSLLDRAALYGTIAAMSLPPFLPAALGVLVFALWLGWLPPALWESPASMVLPVAALALRPTAILTRLVRASMIESLGADYIRTALGKGLSYRRVVYKHALRNSLIPVLSQLGPIAAHLATGSFLVETIFQIPGLGTHFIGAVLNRDYPLVMGLTLTYGTALVACNLAVDLLYAVVDPRMRVRG